jgi:hypothetical protein
MEGAGAKEGDAGNLDAVTAGRSTGRGGVVPRAPLTQRWPSRRGAAGHGAPAGLGRHG